jgi:hypothetical protein
VAFFAAASQTFFGQSLPSDWLGWLVLLIAIWGGLSLVQVVGERFVAQNRKRPVDLQLEGYILPAGWIVWGGLLVYGEPGPFSVLLFLVGVMAMLIAARVLRR